MNGQKSFLTPISILILVVAAILAWIALHPRPAPVQTIPVKVGPAAKDVNPEKASVHATNTVSWTLVDTAGQDDAVRTLYIEFEQQEVFPRSKEVPGSNPKRFRVPCVGPYCLSGAVGPNAVAGKDYKYWQIAVDAAGNADTADGHIIIVRP
jgi:hypothetical protein